MRTFVNGMARLLSLIERRGLENIRLHRGDAVDVIDRLPDASLSRVYCFIRSLAEARQRKRRFISATRSPVWRGSCAPARSCASPPTSTTTRLDARAAARLAGFPLDGLGRGRLLQPWEGWTRTKYEGRR